jgi:hypothetical protein
MEKVVRIGSGNAGSVFCKIEFNDDKLSISGVEGPLRNGNCKGSCGQILDHISISKFADGWNQGTLDKFIEVWNRWHLNDMNPCCKHQRELFDTKKKLELIDYIATTKFYKEEGKATSGNMTAEEYLNFSALTKKVYKVTIPYKRPKYETQETKDLIEAGYIREGKREIKTAGWVYPEEHPEGLLAKPCPVCGYKYGTAWIKEEVPQDIIDFLFNLPDSDMKPAWV